MFGLDNNVLLGLVGVVVVFCLLTNKKSFKSLMKKDMLVIVGLTLLLACCMAKGGRIVEGFDPETCTDEPSLSDTFMWYATHVTQSDRLLQDDMNLSVNTDHSGFCDLESAGITDMQCKINYFGGMGMGGFSNYENMINDLDKIKENCNFVNEREPGPSPESESETGSPSETQPNIPPAQNFINTFDGNVQEAANALINYNAQQQQQQQQEQEDLNRGIIRTAGRNATKETREDFLKQIGEIRGRGD